MCLCVCVVGLGSGLGLRAGSGSGSGLGLGSGSGLGSELVSDLVFGAGGPCERGGNGSDDLTAPMDG